MTLDIGPGLIGMRLPIALVSGRSSLTVPWRPHDNMNSGYAVLASRANITTIAQACQRLIEVANINTRRITGNTRARRLRNG